MYTPEHFTGSERNALEIVRAHPFATLVTVDPKGAPEVSHLPLLLTDEGELEGHIARANPQCRALTNGANALAIFHGPHAFVSSAWYKAPETEVPTWNFCAVHAQGTVRVLVDPMPALRALVKRHQPEGHPMPLDPPAPEAEKIARGVLAFSLRVTKWEGKFKLSQNRGADNVHRVIEALRARGTPDDHAVATWMEKVSLLPSAEA